MKTVIIKQGGGIGDILFSLKIAKILHEEYKCLIVWPLHSYVYEQINEYIKIPYVKWENEKNYDWLNNYKYFSKSPSLISSWVGPNPVKVNDDTIIFPLCEAAQTPGGEYKGGSIMCSKYQTFNFSFENWQDSILIQRNKEKEEELFYKVLQLSDKDDYIFVNKKYNRKIGIPIDSLYMSDEVIKPVGRVVEGRTIPGFNVFDWLKVYENAKDIHIVNSSIFYILDSLEKKLPEIKIYNRDDNNDLSHLHPIKPTLRQKWKYVETEKTPTIPDSYLLEMIKCKFSKQ